MKLSDAGELSLLDILRKRFRKKAPGLLLGIGDDAAVIRPGKKNILLTTDMMVEGVHFDFNWTTPFQLGFKLVSVNVSDIYAMGGTPEFLLLDFAAGGDFDMKQFGRLFDGIGKALEAYNISLIGGDISASNKVVLSATVTGSASKVLTRGGARAGDLIYVTGFLGDSACGLEVMKRIGRAVEIEKGRKDDFPLGWSTVLPLVKRHLMPEAVKPGGFVRSTTAMMDISDGLLMDLSRLCKESRVGAKIYEEKIPISPELRKAAEYLNKKPLDLAMGGGEDYQLLFTAPGETRVDAYCIGEVTGSGMKLVNEKGKARNIKVRGYQHFAV